MRPRNEIEMKAKTLGEVSSILSSFAVPLHSKEIGK